MRQNNQSLQYIITIILKKTQTPIGTTDTNVLEGEVPDTPNLYIDKQTIAAKINNAYVEGLSAVIYTDCEVYPILGINTDVCFLFQFKQLLVIPHQIYVV